MDDLAAMARMLEALRPWLGHLAIIGGWAHHLYRYHSLARKPDHEVLRTRDADIAFSRSAPLEGDIAAALGAAGFREELVGEFRPPATHYWLGDTDQGFSVEFLVPPLGDGLRRDGERDATVARAGVTAQVLRHVDLLLVHPWDLRLDASHGFPLPEPVVLRLANPVSFITQKLLIQKKRDAEKQAQDVLYIHDTVELFAADVLQREWREHVRPSLSSGTDTKIDRIRRAQFGLVTDVIRAAARIPQDRMLRPEILQATCAYGLERILGRDNSA